MNTTKVAKCILSSRSGQCLLSANRTIGTMVADNHAENAEKLETLSPEFDGFLFQIPGKGGCDRKSSGNGSSSSEYTVSAKGGDEGSNGNTSCANGGGGADGGFKDCEEHKVNCPRPQRPPQPCHCLKKIAHPTKSRECPGPCPRIQKMNCRNDEKYDNL